MFSQDALYHAKCLVALYNRERDLKLKSGKKGCIHTSDKNALAELLVYVESILDDQEISPVLQLSHLKKLYCQRIEQLGGDSSKVHSTRLKEKILSYFPELEPHTSGREILLVRNCDIGGSIKKTVLMILSLMPSFYLMLRIL